jgi:hypothetical protein
MLPEAPNYTNAALVMGVVNLVWIFIALWAAFGFHVVLLTALALNRLISWLRLRRA